MSAVVVADADAVADAEEPPSCEVTPASGAHQERHVHKIRGWEGEQVML